MIQLDGFKLTGHAVGHQFGRHEIDNRQLARLSGRNNPLGKAEALKFIEVWPRIMRRHIIARDDANFLIRRV